MVSLLSWALQTFAILLLSSHHQIPRLISPHNMSGARPLAEPSWQVVGPKRGADKAKVAREVVEWDHTTAALKQ